MDSPYKGGLDYSGDLRAFLQGHLQQADANPIEQRLIEDEAFFREVQETEDELTDEYATGVLPQTDESALAQRRERQPELAQRLAMRKAFFVALHSPPQPAKSSLDSASRTLPSRLSQSRRVFDARSDSRIDNLSQPATGGLHLPIA
jgi:anti-sigma-K factor RskA